MIKAHNNHIPIPPESQTKTEILSQEDEDPSLQLIKEMEARKQNKPKTALKELEEAFAYHETNYPRTEAVIRKMKIIAPELKTIEDNEKPEDLPPKAIIERSESGHFSLIKPSLNLPDVQPSTKMPQRTLGFNMSQSVKDIKQALQKSKKNGTLFKDNSSAIHSTENFLIGLSDTLKNSKPDTIERDIIFTLLKGNKPTYMSPNFDAFKFFDKHNDPKKLSASDIRMLHGISQHLTQIGKIESTPASEAIVKTLGKILDPYPEKFSKINYIFEKTNQDFKIIGPYLDSNDREKLQKALNHIGKDIALVHQYKNLPLSNTHKKLLKRLKNSAIKKHQQREVLSPQEALVLTKQNPNINLKATEVALISIYNKLQEPIYKSRRPVDEPLYIPHPRPN